MGEKTFKKINYQKLSKIFNFSTIFNFLQVIFNFLTISLFEICINISYDCVNYDNMTRDTATLIQIMTLFIQLNRGSAMI